MQFPFFNVHFWENLLQWLGDTHILPSVSFQELMFKHSEFLPKFGGSVEYGLKEKC